VKHAGAISLLLALAVSVSPAAAQDVSPPGSRQALAALLATPPAIPLTPDVRAALVARMGQPVVGWALALATDSSRATPLAVRVAALRVLRYARWHAAVPRLVELAQPYRRPWVLWTGALTALASYPYPELAGFWRELLAFPRRPVREIAVRGLALTGEQSDRPYLAEQWHKESDPGMLRLRAVADSLLQLPLAVRDTAAFAWPPDSAGRFTPSPSWLRALPRGAARR
jgi:hypothetical protein